PFFPSRPWTSPACTVRSTPLSAWVRPYVLRTPDSSSTGSVRIIGSCSELAVGGEAGPVALRQRGGRVEQVGVVLPHDARTDVHLRDDAQAAGQSDAHGSAQPAPGGEAVGDLGDELAGTDHVRGLRRRVVREDGDLALRRAGLARVVETTHALRHVHRTQAHLVGGGPDEVDVVVLGQEVLRGRGTGLTVPVTRLVLDHFYVRVLDHDVQEAVHALVGVERAVEALDDDARGRDGGRVDVRVQLLPAGQVEVLVRRDVGLLAGTLDARAAEVVEH